ncbi:MAG: hydrogenase maturation protease [Fimbriimonadaceae bacterium]|nr:hydrogenase maturation protease [Fimbriimonadaceae bacterium]
MRVAVVGVGNPLCGDDGVGPLVAQLVRRVCEDRRVTIRLTAWEPTRLFDAIQGCDVAVLVDACKGGRVGEVRVLDECDVPTHARADSTHGLGLEWAIAMSRALAVGPKMLRIVAVTGRRFDLGAKMTPSVRHGAIKAAERVLEEVRACLAD